MCCHSFFLSLSLYIKTWCGILFHIRNSLCQFKWNGNVDSMEILFELRKIWYVDIGVFDDLYAHSLLRFQLKYQISHTLQVYNSILFTIHFDFTFYINLFDKKTYGFWLNWKTLHTTTMFFFVVGVFVCDLHGEEKKSLHDEWFFLSL